MAVVPATAEAAVDVVAAGAAAAPRQISTMKGADLEPLHPLRCRC